MGTLQDIIKKELQPTSDGRVLGKATLGTPYGFRTCLWGDSMTSQYMGDQVTTGSIYDTKTGELTVTGLLALTPIVGQKTYLYALNYPALEVQRFIAPIRRIDANTLVFSIEKGLDLPAVLDNSIFIKDPRILMGNSWVNWLNIYSGQAFNVVYNGAASGATAKQCYQNIDAMLEYNPEVVLVQLPGVNDWSSLQSNSYESTWGYAEAGLKKILSTGARIVALTITPVRTGEGRANIAAMSKVAAYRQKLFEFCKRHSNIIAVDSYSQVVDPTDTTGLATDYINSVDHIHYSAKGAQKIGKFVWNQIKGTFPVPTSSLPSSVIDCYGGSAVTVSSMTRANGIVTGTSTGHGIRNGEFMKVVGDLSAIVPVTVINANTVSFPWAGTDGAVGGTVTLGRNRNIRTNPLGVTTGGTVTAPVTGAAPANFTVQQIAGTSTASVATTTRADGYGNDAVITITPASAGTVRCYFTDPGGYLKNMIPGKKYYLELEITTSGVSGSSMNNLRPQCWFTIGGVNYFAQSLEAMGVLLPFFTEDFTGVARTGTIKLPVDTPSYSFSASVDLAFSAAGSQVIVKIGRVQIVEVD